MNYYCEITLLNDKEMGYVRLLNRFYQRLHCALCSLKTRNGKINIGVSFPEYFYKEGESSTLGKKIRLFSNQSSDLEQIIELTNFEALWDYMHCKSIRQVPYTSTTQYAQYSREARYSKDKTKEIIIRQLAKKYPNIVINPEAIEFSYSEMPYVTMKSNSSEKNFSLFIKKTLSNSLIQNGFTTYGLSNSSTVPEF
jgi:CRISPR-associated endonuclease Csy4